MTDTRAVFTLASDMLVKYDEHLHTSHASLLARRTSRSTLTLAPGNQSTSARGTRLARQARSTMPSLTSSEPHTTFGPSGSCGLFSSIRVVFLGLTCDMPTGMQVMPECCSNHINCTVRSCCLKPIKRGSSVAKSSSYNWGRGRRACRPLLTIWAIGCVLAV
jgi:hypothetical protein